MNSNSLIGNFVGAPGVPIIVQSARSLMIGEVLHVAVRTSGALINQPFSVLRMATREEWIAAMRELGYPDDPDQRAVCFAEVVTD